MEDFLKFIDELRHRFPVHVEIYYSKIVDWCITVYKKGCANDYPNSARNGDDAVLCNVQDCDIEYCFAKAYVAVKDWMLDNNGGY